MSRFIICRASAGSGKTYTLVRQFIETAISSPSQLEHRFEHILAITFTNKAANGMKERIMSQLHSIVEGESEELCGEMAKHLSVTVDEIRRRCAIVQTAILHHYSELSVCTIDSFVHHLVRTFAHDLRLPMNFDVMIDNQQIVQSSVDELLSLAGTEGNNPLTKVLCAYTQSRMDMGKSYRLESQIEELAKEIFKEQTPRYLEELKDVNMEDYLDIHKKLAEECRKVEAQLTAAAQELMSAVSREGLTVDDFPYNKSGALSLFLRLANRDYSKLNDSYKRADEAYEKGLWGSKTPKELRARMESLMPAYRKAYETVKGILSKELTTYNSRQLLLSNIFGLALLSQLSQIKNEYYKENEIVHISEFNKKIAEEVMNEPTPFIYERIGSRYNNYMIDEFQDTSKLQWSNFLPLLDEAMTHDFSSDTALPGTQSIVVGDGKQAIYRFRQGDVRQFMMLPQVDSKLHGHSLAGNAQVETLRSNYRTLRNIVEFNNRFFESIIRNRFATVNPELAKLYLGETQASTLLNKQASTLLNKQGDTFLINQGDTFLINQAGTASKNKADLVQEPVKEGGYVQVSFSDRDGIYKNILNTIHHQVDDLGYSYGDIMILARDNDTLVRIADYISKNGGAAGVPIVSSESFLLSGSPEVLLLQSLLEYIYNPRDRVAALQTVRLLNQGDEWELRDVEYDLEKLMENKLPKENDRRAFDVHYLRTLPLYDLCEMLIRIFKLEGKGNRFLSTFMNVVNNFIQKGRADLGEFVVFLKEKMEKLSSATATDLDAVQLMTIHKAKGLEAKIVLYALPQKRARNNNMWVEVEENKRGDVTLPVAFVGIQKNSTIFDAAFEEEARMNDMDRINVLYVAMTRPEEKLFIFCEDTSSSASSSTKRKSDNGSDDSTSNQALLKAFVQSDEKTKHVEIANNDLATGDDIATNTDGQNGKDCTLIGEIYTVGEDFEKPQHGETKNTQSTIGVDKIIYPEWENRVSIAQQSAALLSPFDQDNRRYGILIHDLLAHVRVVEDIDEVVDNYCEEHELNDSIRNDILTRIKAMLDRDDVGDQSGTPGSQTNRRFFDGSCKVMCEVPMAVDGNVKRPDRIVFAENETFVVDFKTGTRDEKSHAKYQRQVAEYARALSAMGYSNVKPVIVYL